jgi:hypothetical protein
MGHERHFPATLAMSPMPPTTEVGNGHARQTLSARMRLMNYSNLNWLPSIFSPLRNRQLNKHEPAHRNARVCGARLGGNA